MGDYREAKIQQPEVDIMTFLLGRAVITTRLHTGLRGCETDLHSAWAKCAVRSMEYHVVIVSIDSETGPGFGNVNGISNHHDFRMIQTSS